LKPSILVKPQDFYLYGNSKIAEDPCDDNEQIVVLSGSSSVVPKAPASGVSSWAKIGGAFRINKAMNLENAFLIVDLQLVPGTVRPQPDEPITFTIIRGPTYGSTSRDILVAVTLQDGEFNDAGDVVQFRIPVSKTLLKKFGPTKKKKTGQIICFGVEFQGGNDCDGERAIGVGSVHIGKTFYSVPDPSAKGRRLRARDSVHH
jgi:hypothetical protein